MTQMSLDVIRQRLRAVLEASGDPQAAILVTVANRMVASVIAQAPDLDTRLRAISCLRDLLGVLADPEVDTFYREEAERRLAHEVPGSDAIN